MFETRQILFRGFKFWNRLYLKSTILTARSIVRSGINSQNCLSASFFIYWPQAVAFNLLSTFRIPLKTYALLAFLTVATMGLSNTSVGYLNYPTQVNESIFIFDQLLKL